MRTPNPIGQWGQARAMVCQPPKLALHVASSTVQCSAKLRVQQIHRTQTPTAMSPVAQLRARPFPLGDKLETMGMGCLVQWIAIETLISQDVPAPFYERDQMPRDFRLTDIECRRFPSVGDRCQPVNGVHFIAFRKTPAGFSPRGIRVFTVRADDQGLAIDPPNPSRDPRRPHVLLHDLQNSLDLRSSQPSTHRRLRRQGLRPQIVGPVLALTRPACRSIVEYGPQVDCHDLVIEKTSQAATRPRCRSRVPTDTVLSRVRVPLLVSCKKELQQTSMSANSFVFPPPLTFHLSSLAVA